MNSCISDMPGPEVQEFIGLHHREGRLAGFLVDAVFLQVADQRLAQR